MRENHEAEVVCCGALRGSQRKKRPSRRVGTDGFYENKKYENRVSCEFYRLSGWYSSLQALCDTSTARAVVRVLYDPVIKDTDRYTDFIRWSFVIPFGFWAV